MVTRVRVKPNSYYDSVTLMTVASAVSQLPGVTLASLVMGTELNRQLLRDNDLQAPETSGAGPNDLIVAVRADGEDAAEAALDAAERSLARPAAVGAGAVETRRPRTLGAALAIDEGLNLALVSVPGPFAALEAEDALRAGRHVFLFSDNVPLAEEVRLKRLATDLGLLVMGPDCGTAILNGVGLGFANVVRRGPIGLVGASGTGLQQVTCLIDGLGSGISQAIGSGGRDVRSEVGGRTMLAGIAALGADDATRVIVLVAKPPAAEVQERLLAAASATGKPVVAVFIGAQRGGSAASGAILVSTLAEAAIEAVALAGVAGRPATDRDGLDASQGPPGVGSGRRAPGQQDLRGVFSGGTLCEEALALLGDRLQPMYSNVALEAASRLSDPARSRGHTLVDLGSDEFTVGRPHPMIDPTLRNDRLRQEAADPATACLLLDVVLGFGAHPDPAGPLAPVLRDIRQRTEAAGRTLPVVVSLCGTEGDPQQLSRQAHALREAGALVYTSNAAAARAAGAIVEPR